MEIKFPLKISHVYVVASLETSSPLGTIYTSIIRKVLVGALYAKMWSKILATYSCSSLSQRKDGSTTKGTWPCALRCNGRFYY